MIYNLTLTPGQNAGPVALGFRAFSIQIDNSTNQWWYVKEAQQWVQKYSYGVVFALDGVQQVTILATSPSSSQSTVIPGETGQVTITDQKLTVTSGLVAPRPQFYDRRPTTLTTVFQNASVAPYLPGNVIVYTVPAGRVAFLEAYSAFVYRQTVAGASSNAQINLSIIPQSGSGQLFLCYIATNIVGNRDDIRLTQLGTLPAASQVFISMQDQSTGGIVLFNVAIKILEFDA